MATYSEIQDYIKQKHGYTVKTCWIAHIKELTGLKPELRQTEYQGKRESIPAHRRND